MVTVEFKGRLANYMFQIAATVGHAVRHNDTAEFERYIESPEFRNHYTDPVSPAWFPDFGLPARTRQVEFVYQQKDGAGYEDIPYKPNMMLKGFFQSYKYFDHVKDHLVNEVFRVPVNPQADTVGIHIRRQDYWLYPDHFPMLPDSYYLSAIEEIGHGKRLLFFSDDIPYCEQHYGHLENVEFVRGHPLHDIMLLANCEHFIVANSSFSWMAAYLCRNPHKMVICPSKDQWYGKLASIDTSDFIPDAWQQREITFDI
jgi:hypothetical protein